MNHKALQTIQRFQLFRQGDSVAVALSGGADSVALLHCLLSIREDWQLNLSALHFNHLLRGDESDRDENFVRQLCRQLKIELAVDSRPVAEIALKEKLSLEECARRERYAFFQRTVSPQTKIATAHTLSDQLETVLLQLTRGSGLKGLCGIPPIRGNIIRPLLDCTRAEVEDYCSRHQLDYVTDSTNQSTDYTRNRIRHNVIPLLLKENPALHRTIGSMVDLLREDEACLDALAAEKLNTVKTAQDGVYHRPNFLLLPSPVSSRMLIQMLRERELHYNRERLTLMRRFIEQGSGGVQLSSCWYFRVNAEHFSFYKPQEKKPFFIMQYAIKDLPDMVILPLFASKKIQIQRLECKQFEKNDKNLKKVLKNAVDYDRIGTIMTFRQKIDGDKIRLFGRNCTKSLRKLFQEAKIPPHSRDTLVVMADEGGQPLWVEDFGPCENAAITPATQTMLLFKIIDPME